MPEWTKGASACWGSSPGFWWRGISRLLKTCPKTTPRTENLVAPAVQWAERIMRKVDNLTPSK
jgi:hypothetical protein